MKKDYIEPFDYQDKFYFTGADLFSSKGNNFLLNSCRNACILLDDDCVQALQTQDIPDDLLFKLYQRGFMTGINTIHCVKKPEIRPVFFLINLTDNCNLRCKYCFRQLDKENCRQIDYHTLENICKYILAYCRKYGVRHFTIQFWGGEPLLVMDKIIFVQEFFKKTTFHPKYVMETNGTLIQPWIAHELVKRDIQVGVSIDGSEYFHDLQRPFANGKGSFHQTVLGIKNLKAAGYEKVATNTVITKYNIDDIEQILNYFVKQLELSQVKFSLIKKTEFSPESYQMSDISDSELEQFYDHLISKVIDLNKKGYTIYERNICDKLLNLVSRRNRNICSSSGCMGGYKIISFDTNGNIYPCNTMDYKSVKIGSIYDILDLVELIEASMQTSCFFKEKKNPACTSCPWHSYCKGGCSASSICGQQNIDEMECRVNRILYPKLIQCILEQPEAVSILTNNQVVIVEGGEPNE